MTDKHEILEIKLEVSEAENERLKRHYLDAHAEVGILRDELELLNAENKRLKEIEAAALDAFYLHGYHKGACMCVDCRLAMILKENSDSYRQDQATVKAMSAAERWEKPE